jgi:hypothetical protein
MVCNYAQGKNEKALWRTLRRSGFYSSVTKKEIAFNRVCFRRAEGRQNLFKILKSGEFPGFGLWANSQLTQGKLI